MAYWFWNWWVFSFLGYLLEKAFARVNRAEKQNRKCFILLPLCPVYGFSVIAMLALPEQWQSGRGFLAASLLVPCFVEYVMHWYYETCFGVHYWDYGDQPLNINGRVCLLFALFWTALLPFAVRVIAPAIAPAIGALPPWLSFWAWMLLAGDWLWSRMLLRRFGDTELLSAAVLYRILRRGEWENGEKSL